MTNPSIAFIMQGRRQRQRKWLLTTCLLAGLAIVLCCAMLMLGNTIYPARDVLRALAGEQLKGVTFAIQSVRLPRTVAGLLAGFAFGVAGSVFQTMLRNPLANPNIIGITAGSSAAAVFCILVLHTSNAVVSAASVASGLIVVLIIYFLSKGRVFSISRLILVGIGIQAMLDALISYMLLIARQYDIPAAIRWLSGSLNGLQLYQLPPLAIALAICTPVVLLLGKQLALLELGEQSATSLGVSTDRVRIALIFGSVGMIALATATTGPIAFVAFLSGPIAKRLVGSGFSSVLPAGLVGAILVLAADLVGQFALAVRYPVGVITGMLGAPFLIFLLIRMYRKGDL